jgi:hypothetical protein
MDGMELPGARRARAVLAFACVIVVCAGCASAEDGEASGAARDFFAAVAAQDWDQACARLAPQASKGLESGGQDCAQAIAELKLQGGNVTGVQVWGDRAQVTLTGDTVFLARFPTGWKVTAAGCTPSREGPYDCDVEA